MKKNIDSILYIFSGILFIIYLYLPIVLYSKVLSLLLLFSSIVIFVISVIRSGYISKYVLLSVSLMVAFTVIVFFTEWYHTMSIHNKLFLSLQFWYPCVFCMCIESNSNVDSVRVINLLGRTIILLYFFSSVTTIIGNIIYENPSRFLATSDLSITIRNKYYLFNIGGFGFCYSAVVVLPMILSKRFFKSTVLTSVFALTCCACAICSQYMILVLLIIIELFLALFFMLSSKRKMICAISTMIVLLIVLLNLDYIYNFFDIFTKQYPVINKRIFEIYSFIKNQELGTDLNARASLYLISLYSFLKNPIFGNGVGSRLGMHSEILDLLGGSGIMGCSVLVALIYVVVSFFKKQKTNNYNRKPELLLSTTVALIILALVNPVLTLKEISLSYFIMICAYIEK